MSSFPRPLFNSFKHLGRNWFKRTKPNSITSKPHFEFTVASYNVLADKLLNEHPHLYANNNDHTPWVFDWNYRKSNLIAEIIYSNVDILCLQEVQEEHYYNWFHPKLKEQGYCGIYKKRSGDKPDGCATFFKQNLFTMHSYELIDFYRPNNSFMDRNNVAIVVILNPISKDLMNPSPICIGNTHLLFNKKRGDIKLAQLAHLFAEIDRCTKSAGSNMHGSGAHNQRMPVVICGDFNSTPYSPLYDFVTKGRLNFQGLPKMSISGQHGTNRVTNHNIFGQKVFPPDLGLTHTCKWHDNMRRPGSSNAAAADPSNCEFSEQPGVLRHDFQFQSCYKHRGLDGTQEVTTCHDKACSTVDYIFFSPNSPSSLVRESQTSKELSNLSDRQGGCHQLWLSGVLSLLSEIELNAMGKLPNREISSDHLLLMASFVLT